MVCAFGLIVILAGVVYGAHSSSRTDRQSGPPTAEVKPVVENIHGTKIVDNYRWLEDANSPETQKWVGEEGAYTRGLLDGLPGRE